MEGIQGHLSGGLSHTLSTDAANILTWMDNALLEPRLDFSKHPVESWLCESVSLNQSLGIQQRSEVDFEKPSRVNVCIIDYMIVFQMSSWDSIQVSHENVQLV
jgi:hypothetical protein